MGEVAVKIHWPWDLIEKIYHKYKIFYMGLLTKEEFNEGLIISWMTKNIEELKL